MFWKVSGIGTEVIGLLWNFPFLEYSTGLFFLGVFISFVVPSWSLLFYVSCFRLWFLTVVFCLLLFVSCFRLWFLTVVSVSNTQGKTPPVPGSTITLVLIP